MSVQPFNAIVKPKDLKQSGLGYSKTAHIGLQADLRPYCVMCYWDVKGVPPAQRMCVTKGELCTMMLLALDV